MSAAVDSSFLGGPLDAVTVGGPVPGVGVIERQRVSIAALDATTKVPTEVGDATNHALRVNVIASVGGGGGGPVTVADCADVTQGCIADAAVGDAAGTVNAHVRQIAKLLGGSLTVIQPTGSLLNVQVSNFPASQVVTVTSGTVTANQGTANATPWNENVAQWGGAATTLGQKLAASSVPVVLASDQSSVTVTSAPSFSTRVDTYTAVASGTLVNVSTAPLKSFSIQVKGTGSAAISWDIRLEGSLDGVNFSTILQHVTVTGDGAVLFAGSQLTPSLYFRSRVAGLVLGGATNVVVTILGV